MPNTFDLTYYGLAVVMLGLLGYTAVAGITLRHALPSSPSRNAALGVSLAALGAVVALVSGVALTDLYRAGLLNGLADQQARFSLFDVGFGLILYGVTAVGRRWPAVLWVGFAATVIIADAFLFDPNSYTYTQSGTRVNAVQQLVFYLPIFFVTASGVLTLLLKSARSRPQAIWFAAFSAAVLVGFLRESTIIPTLGDPELDLLVAFVPFVLGSACLLMSARSLAGENTWKESRRRM